MMIAHWLLILISCFLSWLDYSILVELMHGKRTVSEAQMFEDMHPSLDLSNKMMSSRIPEGASYALPGCSFHNGSTDCETVTAWSNLSHCR